MTFSKEEMEILSKYEQYFHTATKANYTRNPGRTAPQEMHRIFKSATGSAIGLNTGCGHCIYSLVKAVAVAYYKDKEELEALATKEVKAEDIPAETEKKVSVKTKTKKAKKCPTTSQTNSNGRHFSPGARTAWKSQWWSN